MTLRRFAYGSCALTVLVFAAVMWTAPAGLAAPGQTGVNWWTYLNNSSRSGYDGAETAITPATASQLREIWHVHSTGAVSAEPIEFDGTVYWGSWSGFEHASTTSGRSLWQTNLGTTTDDHCNPRTVGVGSTPTIASLYIAGKARNVDLVGGGNGYFYALDAATGAVLWRRQLGTPPSYFLWSSPLVLNGSIYEGVSSFGSCPSIRGELVKMNAFTGAIQGVFYTVPKGCIGGGVWGTPTYDPTSGDIYFATGNNNTHCRSAEPLAVAIVKVSPSLTLISHWNVPLSQHGPDSDFGTTPTLFTATIHGTATPMVGLQNKNGVYYAFRRSALDSGPVWETRIATAGSCPECGTGDISPSAWNGSTLYVAGGHVTMSSGFCAGSISAINPATGAAIWRKCLQSGAVIGAVTLVPGVAFIGEGTEVLAVSLSNGATLFRFTDNNPGSQFWGPASIANGRVYIGNQDGNLYSFGL